MTRRRTTPLRHSCEGRNPAPTKTPAPAANPIHPQHCPCCICIGRQADRRDGLTIAAIAVTMLVAMAALGAATGALIHLITQTLWSAQP